MESVGLDAEMLRSFRKSCVSVLNNFAASPSSFKVIRTVPQLDSEPASAAKTLYILDASFNPPTKAHSRLVTSAICNDAAPASKRVLLLLATQNADKPTKPAPLEDRLVMMTLLAHELLYDIRKQGLNSVVDIGLVKLPFFHDKASAVDESGVYAGNPQQVHLTGFDTLVRIFDTKYYPPEQGLRVLRPFLSKHRLRTTLRADHQWGSQQDQEQYVQEIAKGNRLGEGAQPEWTRMISLVQGRQDGEDTISSTLARRAANGDAAQLDKYVNATVRDWVTSEQLYREDD